MRQPNQLQPELAFADSELNLHVPEVVTSLEQTLVAPQILSIEMMTTVQLSLRFEVVCSSSNTAVFYLKIHTVDL